jgi:peptidase M50-like protein
MQPGGLWFFATLYVLATPMVLWHELGHALAARAFVDHGVSVQVGRGDRWKFHLRDIEFRLGAPSLIGIGGLCYYPESVTAFESLVIALAGPFATLLGMGLALALLPSLHGPLHAATALAAAAQFTGFVLNLVPFTLTDRSGRRFRTDGRRALDALQSMAGSGAPVSVPSISPAGQVTAQQLVPMPLPSLRPTPSCGRCGHSRGEHVDLTTGQPGGCLGQDYDFQSLSARVCDCGAFVATRAS